MRAVHCPHPCKPNIIKAAMATFVIKAAQLFYQPETYEFWLTTALTLLRAPAGAPFSATQKTVVSQVQGGPRGLRQTQTSPQASVLGLLCSQRRCKPHQNCDIMLAKVKSEAARGLEGRPSCGELKVHVRRLAGGSHACNFSASTPV